MSPAVQNARRIVCGLAGLVTPEARTTRLSRRAVASRLIRPPVRDSRTGPAARPSVAAGTARDRFRERDLGRLAPYLYCASLPASGAVTSEGRSGGEATLPGIDRSSFAEGMASAGTARPRTGRTRERPAAGAARR